MKWRWLFSLLPVLLTGSFTELCGQHKKPNIILILADDLGVGDVGVYGQKKIKTPNLDRLAREGVQFNQFYAGTSVCAPSRSSLMTGQHTGHTPVRGNKATKPEGQWPLPEGTVTIAGLLKEAGYATGDFGKWGLGFVGTTGDPNKQGFDEFFGYNCQSLAHNYFPEHLWHNASKVSLPNTNTSQTVYAAQLIHDKAREFIQKNSRQPFFLFLSYTLPHAALQLPANDSLLAYYVKAFEEKPVPVATGWQGKGYQPQAYPHAAYAAMVGRLDQYVGEVRKQVEALGIADNTLILFASDNGPHKEGGNDPSFFNSSAGLKGIKRDLYEGGLRTPFIAWWPGTIQAGRQSEFAGAFWDLLPTFAELAGVKAPQATDGISIVPELKNSSQKNHEYLYWEFHEQGGKQAVRIDNWKGIRLNTMTHADGPIELYNLQSDPAEQHNVAAAHPDVIARIADIMKKEHVENDDFPFSQNALK
jgi:arylsulfatase A-like enzyme